MVPAEKYYLFLNSCCIVLIAILVYVCSGCKHNEEAGGETVVLTDLEDIKQHGVLKVAVDYNSINYFLYRGKPMGYQYELIHLVCKDLGVVPEIVVSKDLAESIMELNNGMLDLIAMNLVVTPERKQEVAFTRAIKQTRQVIVQRKQKYSAADSLFLKSPAQLVNKTIHVQVNSAYGQRLEQLSEELGREIFIIRDSVNKVEQLIGMVSRGEIDYTVCDENAAMLYRSYYPNLDVSLKISYPQNIAWAIRKESVAMKAYLDDWIADFKKTDDYRLLYNKYFKNPRIGIRYNNESPAFSSGKISAYDELVKELASKYNWDWRLISSIIYHESRFEPEVESWGGAVGLMQLMPATAESMGVEDIRDPRQNIEGGILLLNWLDDQLKYMVADSAERIKFVLAAYNIGLSPVQAARRRADADGKNNEVWDGYVDYYVENEPIELAADSTTVQRKARGEEAVNFVRRVLYNYQHYFNVIPE